MFLLSILIAGLAICHGFLLDGNNLFPTLPVGKDGAQVYFVHANVGNTQPQQLAIDLMLPYTTLSSGRVYPEFNYPKAIVPPGGGLYYPEHSLTHQNISNNILYNMSALSFFNLSFTLGSDVLTLSTVRYSVDDSVELGNDELQWDLTWGSLNFSRASFFEAELTSAVSATLGLGARISVNSEVMDSDNYGSSFYYLENARDAGLISTASYSLWLGNDGSQNSDFITHEDVGRLILGGVDPRYYTGDIFEYDTLPYQDPITEVISRNYPILPLTKVNLINSTGAFTNLTAPSFKEPVLLDIKSAVSYLPPELFTQVASQTRGYYSRTMSALYVDCSVADINATLRFEFGNAAIHVPLSHFVKLATANVVDNTDRFNQTCYLQISPNTETGFTILGRAFLRSVYLAMDLEGLKVGIAQGRNGNDTSSSTLSSSMTPASIISGNIPYAKTASVDDESLTLTVRQDAFGLRGVSNTTRTDSSGTSKTFYSNTLKVSSATGLSSTTVTNASGHFTAANRAHSNTKSLRYNVFSFTSFSVVTGGFITLGIIVTLSSSI